MTDVTLIIQNTIMRLIHAMLLAHFTFMAKNLMYSPITNAKNRNSVLINRVQYTKTSTYSAKCLVKTSNNKVISYKLLYHITATSVLIRNRVKQALNNTNMTS